MEPEPSGAAFFAWSQSRPNEVGAGVGSETSDFGRSKKWRLRNTGKMVGILSGKMGIFGDFVWSCWVGWLIERAPLLPRRGPRGQ